MKYFHAVGLSFGELTVLSYSGERDGMNCLCSCGKAKVARLCHLRSGSVKSCGCLLISRPREVHGKNLASHTKEYKTWNSMIQRCTRKTNPAFHHYGGRGIYVCSEWIGPDGLHNFLRDMGPKVEGKSLDRINNNGPYSKENCRWADDVTQGNNRRSNHLLSYGDQTKTIQEWALVTGKNGTTIHERLARGWSVADALTKTTRIKNKLFECDGKCRTLTQWANETGIQATTLRYRINSGWSLERALHTTTHSTS